jgi:hypothetical protein
MDLPLPLPSRHGLRRGANVGADVRMYECQAAMDITLVTSQNTNIIVTRVTSRQSRRSNYKTLAHDVI